MCNVFIEIQEFVKIKLFNTSLIEKNIKEPKAHFCDFEHFFITAIFIYSLNVPHFIHFIFQAFICVCIASTHNTHKHVTTNIDLSYTITVPSASLTDEYLLV